MNAWLSDSRCMLGDGADMLLTFLSHCKAAVNESEIKKYFSTNVEHVANAAFKSIGLFVFGS